jgi:hypothetical protein
MTISVETDYRCLENQELASKSRSVAAPQPADTSRRSIFAGFTALAGAASFAVGCALTQVANAKVVIAGYSFMGAGVVVAVAAGILYKCRKPQA